MDCLGRRGQLQSGESPLLNVTRLDLDRSKECGAPEDTGKPFRFAPMCAGKYMAVIAVAGSARRPLR